MSPFIQCLIYLFTGSITGLLSGLLGIGGGLVVVPFLAYFLVYLGLPNNVIMHVAVASSLTVVLPTSLASSIGHYKKNAISFSLIKRMALGLFIGGMVGGRLADLFSTTHLECIFGIFAIFMAYRLAFKKKGTEHGTPRMPHSIIAFLSSAIIAAFCTLVGIGGGTLFVPYFTYYQIPMPRAIGTSSACGALVALFGIISLSFADTSTITALKHVNHLTNSHIMLNWMTGFIYWPAVILITVSSIPFAFLGVKLAHKLPTATLRKIFAALLLIIAIDMLYKVM